MHAQLLSYVQLFATLWTVAHQALLSVGFSGKNTAVGCHSYCKGSSWPMDQTRISCIGRWVLYHWGTKEASKKTTSKLTRKHSLYPTATQKCALGTSSISYHLGTHKCKDFWLHKALLNWNLQFNKILRWLYAEAHQFENPWFLSLILYPIYSLESHYRTLKKKKCWSLQTNLVW